MTAPHEIVVADIGGTHARFAIAEVADGKVQSLGETVKLETASHGSLQTAWEAFGAQVGRDLPDAAAIAIAAPIRGGSIKMTNGPWIVQPALLAEKLNLDRHVLINDFAAVAYAVTAARPEDFVHVTGPDHPLLDGGPVSVIGPGTGLGVAAISPLAGQAQVLATEGGHSDFAPIDAIDDRILAYLRRQHMRVSVERVASGAGLRAIWQVLADLEGRPEPRGSDKELWADALSGSDSIAVAALERFCMILGSVAGDIALTHGPGPVVLAGGLGARLRRHLSQSGFAERFVAKGRYRSLMESLPVKLITMAEPGLFGAAAAFGQKYT